MEQPMSREEKAGNQIKRVLLEFSWNENVGVLDTSVCIHY